VSPLTISTVSGKVIPIPSGTGGAVCTVSPFQPGVVASTPNPELTFQALGKNSKMTLIQG